ncbi:NAD(P)-binding protein [Saccharata proteae CBS 121410]|uniref:NAD(P)-binding protein n=1 Tax=Saccharata proteae CBS 121410 TaxID=1314787 RepID=A0A9P4M0E0_9PEZI|nr:NAD(P)-binding protein [Saccharata proteae CBS 121410]
MPLTSPRKPWHAHITIDLLADVAGYTIFHPFVAWIIPLCLRAQATPYTHTSFRVSVGYAVTLTLLYVLSYINQRIAYGLPRDVDLSEEVIVITGGANGLGLLIAEVYGMRGASVAVLDINGIEAAEEKGITYYKCDVGDRAQLEAVAKLIEKDLGPPTILINNAGIAPNCPLLSLPPSELDRNFRVNLLAHYHTLQLFLPHMLSSENGGTIVTVASVLGHLGAARLSAYTAAKAGLIAMHTSLCAELRQHPNGGAVKTILVTPGQLATDLFADVRTPSQFLGPLVEPVVLAKEIVRMVDAGEGGEISFPLYARWAKLIGVLPVGLQWVLRSLAGVDRAMGEAADRVSKKD